MGDFETTLADRLDAQVERASEGDWGDVLRRAGERRAPRRWRRRMLFALPAALVVAGGASAATGVLSLGDVIDGHGFGHTKRTVRETVVAEGASAGMGRWRISRFTTGRGLVCLKARLLDDRRARGDGGYCAAGDVGGFGALSVGDTADAARRGSVVVFGPAPARARSAVLSGAGGPPRQVMVPRPPGSRLGYWLIAAPPGLARASMRWTDGRHPFGRRLDVAASFGAPSPPRVVLRTSAPGLGRMQLSVSESRRTVDRATIVEPEGLPCVTLRLLGPPSRAQPGAGGCGAFRKAPGFFKVEQRVPSQAAMPVEKVVLFGRAPAEARRVEVVKGGKAEASTPARRGPSGTLGRFWLLALPAKRAHGTVRWSGARQHGPAIRVFGP